MYDHYCQCNQAVKQSDDEDPRRTRASSVMLQFAGSISITETTFARSVPTAIAYVYN